MEDVGWEGWVRGRVESSTSTLPYAVHVAMQAFGLCDSKDVARAPTTACLGVRDTWERIEVMMKKEHKRDRKLAKVTRECEGQVCLVTEAMPMALWVCACLCIIFSYAELVPLTIVCALCMQLFLVLGRDPIMIGVDAIDDVADRQTCDVRCERDY
eukprot:scaffold125548_cov33-Tisochrysis_lutea.AAC.1